MKQSELRTTYPVSVALDDGLRLRIELERERRTCGEIRPSLSEIMREAMRLGLAAMDRARK